MNKKIAIIGSGFSGLSAAAYASKMGNEVHVLRKTAVWADVREVSKPTTVTRSIWDQVGIGCLISSKTSSKTSIKNLQIITN